MPEIAVTLVGNIDSAVQNRAAQAVKETGVDDLRIDLLHPGRAVDILVKGDNAPALTAALRQKLAGLGAIDVFVQPNDSFRRKRLLVADMDATMVVQETLDELAAHVNLKDQIAAITGQAMRGEIDFHDALRMRVKMLKGLKLSAIFETLAEVEYSPGAHTLIRTLRRHAAKCVLVSGGFTFFTKVVAQELGFNENFGNTLGVSGDVLTGEVFPPIIDKDAKERLVVDQARALGCDLRQIITVGDGANDIPMLKKAGVGVGYFGKPAVVAATPYQVRHTDLTALLYLQGYRQQELAV